MKRLNKTKAPSDVQKKFKSVDLDLFCEVYIPSAPSIYTYGIPKGVHVKRGSLVWVQFSTRKKALLALVAKITDKRPTFDVRCVFPHTSNYVFNERFMESLEWVARYYICTPMKALNVFWPADFEKFIDAYCDLDSKKNENESNSGDGGSNFSPLNTEEDSNLTEEQEVALKKIKMKLKGKGFRGILLHGVTGSGKTRVYQELVKEALNKKLKVLILVPEIGLTPQTAKRFEKFLRISIPVLHSALSAPKKRAAYLSILRGNTSVVLGTRSAILAPFDFDVVILDEEHDSSFKQQDPAPRYHTRELAFHLAHKYGALVVLGSATPSLESFYNASLGHLEYISLKKRATNAPLPEVKILDMSKVHQQKGILMAPELRDALTETIASNNQAIILMNRRGYSKIRVCSQCGGTLYCKNCHVPLVYHRQYSALMCHYCNLIYPQNTPCASCGEETYEYVGGAIEKLEEEIIEWIPNAHVIRMDRDTTQNVGSIDKILESFRKEEYNILLGTQMVAKGHDFPNVSLVGIVGADSGLGAPDFRGTERMFQLLSQTAGRAGRACGKQGKVYIQTLNPSDPVMQFALNHDYNGFAKCELSNRQLALYPPFCKLISISMGAKDENLLQNKMKELETLCRSEKSLTVLGPVDAYVPIIQNVHWCKLYIKTQELSKVRTLLGSVVNQIKGKFSRVEIKVEIE